MSESFVHLHVHSEYSLLESTLTVKKIVALTAEKGMPAVALTDRNNMFAAVEFFSEAKAKGIAPILGCELNVLTEGSMRERGGKRGQGISHLVLLVENELGYRNLCHLISESYLKGFYYKPRVDLETLFQYSEGLIALSGCMSGVIANYSARGESAQAARIAERFAEVYPGRFYIELQRNGRPGQEKLIRELAKLAKQSGLPVVATNDCHYALREGSAAQEVLMCIESGRTLDDFDHDQMPSEEFYFKGQEEMAGEFEDYPEALRNTVAIAERCHFAFDFKTYHFPKFDVPAGKSLEEVLRETAETGLAERLDTQKDENLYKSRLSEELAVICSMGFAGYFLIVADFIQYAKEKGIAVGPGRGSAAGSLVAYVLRITDLDPLPYNLLFERFLNPERISMPDVDIDFCMRRREEVIHYVAQKYGSVSQIITFGKMKAKAVIRDVARVLNMPYAEADKIAKLIPNTLNITLTEAIKQEPRLKGLIDGDSRVERLLGIALELEGLSRHASTHAAGVVISDRPLSEFAPLYKGSNEDIVTHYDMKAVEKIGLIKFDFLGLKTLTILEDAVNRVCARHGIPLDLLKIPLDDAEVYRALSAGDTLGIFQLESRGMRELIIKFEPSRFEDLIALVALYRPGPLGSGMVDDFIDRKHGRKEIRYELPELSEILRETYGVIVYQEQVMQIAARLANYSLGEADLLRRAMGKKKPAEMEAQKKRFLEGALKNRISTSKAEYIFDLMAKFAEYGFNKSHSAAYALVSYQTAYLKTHYRAEYMASLMSLELSDTDKILLYSDDCKTAGIQIFPPNINEGEWEFSVNEHGNICYGLGAIKGVGTTAVESILAARRQGGPFKDLYDFTQRVDLSKANRRVLESLICAGALDCFGQSRKSLMGDLDRALEMGTRLQVDSLLGQTSLFDAFMHTGVQETAKTIPATSAAEWEETERLSKEKSVLGFYLSGHPFKQFERFVKFVKLPSIRASRALKKEEKVNVCGMLVNRKEIKTKNGKRMAFANLEDLDARMEVIFFSDVYEAAAEHLEGERPIVISGELDIGDEETKLIAGQVYSLEAYCDQRARSVHLRFDEKELGNGKLEKLQTILKETPGACPIFIHITREGAWESVMRLGERFSVALRPKLIEQIFGLFGDGNRIELC